MTHRIYTKFDGIGYTAVCPTLTDYKSPRKGGPKMAAVTLALTTLGGGNYTLKRVSFKVYDLTILEGITNGA